MTEPTPLLAVTALRYGPAGRSLAAPLSFSLQAGRCLVLLGPNGAGKTSLLRTLIGSLPALSGSVHWQGRSVGALSARELAATVAFAAPKTGDIQEFNVEQLVLMGRLGARGALAQPDADDWRIVEQVIDRMGLAALRTRRVGSLSDGERQLAALARALAQQARTLILDEPAASLDLGRQARLLETVKSLVVDGQSVILSTHDPNHALAVADDVLLWDEPGRIIWGKADELVEPARLTAMYGEPVRWLRDTDGRTGLVVGTVRRH